MDGSAPPKPAAPLLLVRRTTNDSGRAVLIPVRAQSTHGPRHTAADASQPPPLANLDRSIGQNTDQQPPVAYSPPRRPLHPADVQMLPQPVKRESRSNKLPTALYYKGTREDRRPLSVHEKHNNAAYNRSESRVNRAHTNFAEGRDITIIQANQQESQSSYTNNSTPVVSRDSTINSNMESLSVLSQGEAERADSDSIREQLASISRQTTLQTELSIQSRLPVNSFICQSCEKNIATKQPYRPLCYHIFCTNCSTHNQDCDICMDKIIQNRENTILIRRDDTKDDVFTGFLHHKRRYFQILPLMHKEYSTLAATQKRERQGLLRKYAQFLIGNQLNNPLLISQRVYEILSESLPQAQREAYAYGTTVDELDRIYPKDDPKRASWKIPIEMEIIMFAILRSSYYCRRKLKEVLRRFECDFLNTTSVYEEEVSKRGFREECYKHMTTEIASPSGTMYIGAAIMCNIEERLVDMLQLTFDSLKFEDLHHGEIWLRLGCDRGSGITKVLISVANRPFGRVNSPFNWLLVAAFEAHDDYKQLKKYAGTIFAAFNRIKELKINGTTYPVRKIVIGDVNSLNAMYGLRGAASNYPCYQCTISKECIQRYQHGGIERTDMEAKQKIPKADPENDSKKIDSHANQSYDNVPLLSFNETARAPPCLHMIQGPVSIIFKRIESIARLTATAQIMEIPLSEATLLTSEEELTKAVSVATETEIRRRKEALESFQRLHQKGTYNWTKETVCTPHCVLAHLKKVHKIAWIECSKCKRWQHQLCLGLNGGRYEALHYCGQCSPKQPEDIYKQLKNAMIISEQSSKNAELVKDIHCSPIIKEFRKICNKLHINLGSFHSGLLTGNQCRSLLKNTKVFTNYIRSLSEEEVEVNTLSNVADKLDSMMQPLSKVNTFLAARFLNREEIDQYEKYVNEFIDGWRKVFPNSNGFPKLHILTTESVAFLNRFSTLGICSEQGVESSHPLFNSSWERCSHIKPTGARLAKTMEYHNNRNLLLYSMSGKSKAEFMDILSKETDDT